jgi:hypothetical protein
MVLFLLVLAQLLAVYSLPTIDLNEEDVPTPTVLEPTISYSTAITSLQSLSISILPSITGVCICFVYGIRTMLWNMQLMIVLEFPYRTSFRRGLYSRSCTWAWCNSVRETVMSARNTTSSWPNSTITARLCEHLPANRVWEARAIDPIQWWSLRKKGAHRRWKRTDPDEQVLRQFLSRRSRKPCMVASVPSSLGERNW